MGCDIHAFTEVKIRGVWHCHSVLSVPRTYRLFGRMAGVRNWDPAVAPIALPRGLPDDISAVVRLYAVCWEGDAHSHSWLTASEAGAIESEHGGRKPGDPPLFGYVFGNPIDTMVKYPDDVERERDHGFEDARLVFFFDN